MKLSHKFVLVVLAILAVCMGLTAAVVMSNERRVTDAELLQRAETVAAFGAACRAYTQEVLSPAVTKEIGKDKIIFEAQSRTSVARGTMEQFKKMDGMKEYGFRETSLNPLNDKSRATPFETTLIDRLQKDPNLKELTGVHTENGKEFFYVCRPIVVEKSCLRCHDTPDHAPAALAAKYPGPSGFGWKEGDRNHAFMVTVPTEDLRAAQASTNWKIGGMFGLMTVLLVGGLYGCFHFMVVRRLNQTSSVMREVAEDPATSIRIQDPSLDEIGSTNRAINKMLEKVLPLIQSRLERDKIQASISKLLEEVSGVAEGDLTKEAEVSEDMTGAIADSFNYMTEQLRKIIGNVQDATVQVSSSANEIHATTEHLAQGTEAQSEQIVNTSAAIDEMAVSIQQVSENAARSTSVAKQALTNARQGTESVQNTIQGMNRIRDQVQETARRIKRLGESSQEIGQIIQLIDDIADRTSILALNASIQAAMAGEAGRGFAVVAEEVERLAVRSTDATKKIGTLVKTIQTETSEAVGAMEKSISEVVDGSRVAVQAGKALGEIESVSTQLAELIQSISLASTQQARGSEALAKSMGEISQITQQTATGTKQAAVSVSELASLADGLRDSVSQFRLPGKNGSANGAASGRQPVLAQT